MFRANCRKTTKNGQSYWQSSFFSFCELLWSRALHSSPGPVCSPSRRLLLTAAPLCNPLGASLLFLQWYPCCLLAAHLLPSLVPPLYEVGASWVHPLCFRVGSLVPPWLLRLVILGASLVCHSCRKCASMRRGGIPHQPHPSTCQLGLPSCPADPRRHPSWRFSRQRVRSAGVPPIPTPEM